MIRSKQALIISILVIVFSTLILYQSARLVESNRLLQIKKTGKARIGLYAKSLKDTLQKYRPIPYLLSRDIRIRELLKNNLPAIRVNPHLEDFGHTGNTLIFVLDSQGNTVASSNWRMAESLVGYNFGFRPYFMDARDGTPGSYYAIGIRTGKPGFFISYPVLEEGKFLGVVVVKVDLEQLQEAWQTSGEIIVVSDTFGVLFLSSVAKWKYRSLRTLSEKTTVALQNEQYPGQGLLSLRVKRNAGPEANILHIENTSFLEQSEQLLEYGWRLHYLSDLKPVTASFRQALLIGTGVITSIVLTSLYLRERRQRQRSRREARKAKAIKKLNELLRLEIQQHKQTEKDLKETQQELIQASKLAALGRMSAAIAHELNQPVTAIRTFLASCKILITRNKFKEVENNLEMIDNLTERMMAVTGQLKTFARKSSVARAQVDLLQVVENVLTFLGPKLKEEQVKIDVSCSDRNSYVVLGEPLQLEQVVNNLIQNALDALKDNLKKSVHLTLTKSDGKVLLILRDNGPGISEEATDSLFDPFFTTKEIGEGLGLGLSISYTIVSGMGGTISVENGEQGGAIFTLHFPGAATTH